MDRELRRMYTVKVKVKGLRSSHTQTEYFDEEPTNAEVKSVIAKAKKVLYETQRSSTRDIDTSITPGKPKDDGEESLVLS